MTDGYLRGAVSQYRVSKRKLGASKTCKIILK